jgi:hypothetical protein
VPGQTSAFVPLDFHSMQAEVAPEGVEPTLLDHDGRVVVVGARPLLEARQTAPTLREVVLYGRRNTTYVIEFSTNLVNGVWRTRGTVFAPSMTNLTQTLLLNQPFPPVYYRARQQ